MEFRRKKLVTAVAIMALGTILALAWQLLRVRAGLSYHNFFYPPTTLLDDFTDPLKDAVCLSPFADKTSVYCPFAYGFFRYFQFFDPFVAAAAFMGLTTLGLLALVIIALRPIVPGKGELILCGLGLLIFSYPFTFSWGRGNIEMFMVLLVGLALLYFRDRRWLPGLSFLLFAICLKIYPVLLMAPFFRPRHWTKIVHVVLAFLAVNLLTLASFDLPLRENWNLWQRDLQSYHDNYMIGNYGFTGSASAWNGCKALFGAFYLQSHPTFRSSDTIIPADQLNAVFHIYCLAAFALLLIVGLLAILIEREFFRQVVVLLLVSTMAVPSGPDYKLLFANLALIVLILVPTQRRFDFVVIALLAFALVPKSEYLIALPGMNTSTFQPIPCSILINPLCLLVTIGLLMCDGIHSGTSILLRQRLFRLIRF